jgi:hypothetical protein
MPNPTTLIKSTISDDSVMDFLNAIPASDVKNTALATSSRRGTPLKPTAGKTDTKRRIKRLESEALELLNCGEYRQALE